MCILSCDSLSAYLIKCDTAVHCKNQTIYRYLCLFRQENPGDGIFFFPFVFLVLTFSKIVLFAFVILIYTRAIKNSGSEPKKYN